jgi:molybdopterin synthase catalytic subunit
VDAAPLIDVRLLPHAVHAVPFDPFPQPAGAECVFLGRTREEAHPDHGELRQLSYEAYEPMAQSVLEDLAAEAARLFECRAVRVHHALGSVPPGEASVAVQVVCGHRDAAFAACRFLIDHLKSEAPIWKREEWADGATWSAGNPVRASADKEGDR